MPVTLPDIGDPLVEYMVMSFAPPFGTHTWEPINRGERGLLSPLPVRLAPAEVPAKLKRAIVLLLSLVTHTWVPKTPIPTGPRRLSVIVVPATVPSRLNREIEFPARLATQTWEPTTARSNGWLRLFPLIALPAELPS